MTIVELQKELEIKNELIDLLTEALNDLDYCEDHVVFRKCKKKDLACGDCLVKEFYDSLYKESV